MLQFSKNLIMMIVMNDFNRVNLNGSGKKKHRRRKPQDSVPMSYVTSTDAIAADRPELRALCSQQPSKSSQKYDFFSGSIFIDRILVKI